VPVKVIDEEAEKREEIEDESNIVDEIIEANIGDQTLMTPLPVKKVVEPALEEIVQEDIIKPVKIAFEESEPAHDEFHEKSVEQAAEALVKDTIGQITPEQILDEHKVIINQINVQIDNDICLLLSKYLKVNRPGL
jgi:hypothetical protein